MVRAETPGGVPNTTQSAGFRALSPQLLARASHRCAAMAWLHHVPSESEDDDPPAGGQNQCNTLIELCFHYSVVLVFFESLVPVKALQLSETCIFARVVLC